MRSRLASNGSPDSGTSNWKRFRHFSAAAPMICLFSFLAGCSEQPQDLDERVTQLQKELDRAQVELKSANQALEASKEELARLKNSPANVKPQTAPPSSPVQPSLAPERKVPSRETLEATYIAEAKTLKKQLQDRLKEYTLGSFTLHNVQLPDNQYPITSWISLAFQGSDSQQYRLDFPVKADLNGKWIFPDPDEIGKRVNDAKKVASTSTTSRSQTAAAPPKESPSSNPPTTVPANSTVVIQWPNSSPAPPAPTRPEPQSNTANTQSSPPPQNPAPKTSPPQNPKQSIPADRDVLIRF
ncbi:MAG TPA: hypothetical protein VJS88_07720 [Chthoniobacterales bacterium]|nr:hypothetical protein [Chthoniobacterales bacterium]